MEQLVEEVAQELYQAGKISKLHSQERLFTRMIQINKEFPGASVLLHKKGKLPEALQEIWAFSPLLHVVEQVLHLLPLLCASLAGGPQHHGPPSVEPQSQAAPQ